MLLAIDVGNTTIHCGLFEGNKPVKEKRWETCQGISGYQGIRDWVSGYREIRDIIICSVVPEVDRQLKRWFPKAVFVTHKNIGIKVKVKKPSEVGADRLVNALAAYIIYGGPAIVVDFGTATTFDVINAKGEYLGGAIAPGLLLARDSLHFKTAKLPKVELKPPKQVIGKSTVEAIQSGLILGYVSLVEGMIKRIIARLPAQDSRLPKVIATGGLARLICKQTDVIDRIDQRLTLKGLRLIGVKKCLKN